MKTFQFLKQFLKEEYGYKDPYQNDGEIKIEYPQNRIVKLMSKAVCNDLKISYEYNKISYGLITKTGNAKYSLKVLTGVDAGKNFYVVYNPNNIVEFTVYNNLKEYKKVNYEMEHPREMRGKYLHNHGKIQYGQAGCYGVGISQTHNANIEHYGNENQTDYPEIVLFDKRISKDAKKLISKSKLEAMAYHETSVIKSKAKKKALKTPKVANTRIRVENYFDDASKDTQERQGR